MNLTPSQSVVLKRFLRTLAHAVIATVLTTLASPNGLSLIDPNTAVVLVPVLTAVLNAADKALRLGNSSTSGDGTGS